METVQSSKSLSGMKILVFGIYYTPDTTGIAPYTAAMCEHLAGAGAEVEIVTGVPHYPQWRRAAGYGERAEIREQINGVRVIRLRHYVPSRHTALQRGMYEASFLARAYAVDVRQRPDLVLGVIPTVAGGVAAARFARRFRVPLGVIVQDVSGLAAAQSGVRGGSAVARLVRHLEGRVLRSASRVGIIADGFRDAMRDYGVAEERVVHVPNWSHVGWPQRSRDEVRFKYAWAPSDFVVLHAGNMGLKQALEHVVSAARLAGRTQPHTRFVLMGDGNQRAALEAEAAGVGNIEFLPPQPAEWVADILAAADVLLLNERRTVTGMSLPSKLTSYLTAARPIIAAVPAGGTTAAEVSRSGGGIIVRPEDPAALVAGIAELYRQPELGKSLGEAGAAYCRTHLTPGSALTRIREMVLDVSMDPAPRTRAEPAARDRSSSVRMSPT